MAILIKCKCGKSLNVPDNLAGKKGKCPSCGNIIEIPAKPKSTPPPKQAAPTPQKTPPPGKSDKSCPSCGKSWPADTVICIDCGTNIITGEKYKTQIN